MKSWRIGVIRASLAEGQGLLQPIENYITEWGHVLPGIYSYLPVQVMGCLTAGRRGSLIYSH